MTHPISKVTGFEKTGRFRLRVSFSDGTAQEIDFAPILHGKLYGPLADETLFDQVSIDPEAATLVWPNGADFDPAILHDWPIRKEEWEQLALTWKQDAA